MNLTALLGLAIIVFASTYVDDIFVLLGFFADSRLRARNVVIGQYLGIGALIIVSIAASLISLFLVPVYVGLLGVLPIPASRDCSSSGGTPKKQRRQMRLAAARSDKSRRSPW